MNKRVLFAALAVAAALCACTREALDPNTEATTGEETLVTIKANLEGRSDPETKTYLGNIDMENKTATPYWKKDDSFKLIPHNGAPQTVFTLKGDGGESVGSFVGTTGASAGNVNFSAVYPSTLENITRNGGSAEQKYTISFDLPSHQNGSANNADGQMPAFAYAFRDNTTTTDPPVFNNVTFYNVCALFRIALTSASPVKVGKLEIIDADADAILWGTAYISMINGIDYSAGPNKWNFKLLNDASCNTLTVNYSPAVSLDSSNPTYFYAAIPPGTLASGVTVIVYDDSDNEIDRFSKSSSMTVERAHIIPMATKSLKYTSLSENGTANCYIVENAGLHKFPAVQGNTNVSVGDVDKVEVLWESDGTTTAPVVGSIVSSIGLKDDNVHFSTTGKAGNAVIAAKDEGNNILWSWHIWVPSTEVTSEAYSTGSKPTVMDRNLGALVAYDNDAEASVNALSNGLIYQWGRKDPFPGLATYGISKKTVATCTFTVEASTADTGTTGYATSHPTVFLSKNPSADWMASPNADLWGGADQNTKTEWDPCPPGYKVPNLVLGDFAVESGATAVKLDGKHWYPTTGWYFASDGDLHNVNGGYYWTTNNASSSGSRYYISTNSTFTQGGSGIARGMGMAVRCVAE